MSRRKTARAISEETDPLGLQRLEHVNIRTADVAGMTEWYCAVLGMTNGDRPPFDNPGAWLYVGEHPVVHLVGEAREPEARDPKIEHFAFSATGLGAMIDRLQLRGIPYDTVRVPGIGLLQINLSDPDGNHIHIDYGPEEADAFGL